MQTIRVSALAPYSAGKTLYLASMYRQLSLISRGRSFYLKTDYATSLNLNSTFNTAKDPKAAWPPASRTSNDYQFTVCIPTPQGEYTPLQFNYLDYPGSLLTNPAVMDDPKTQEVIDRLRDAHALLVLLDGCGVLASLLNEPAGERFLNFELTSTFEFIQQSQCPVHFAVTKWDLLDGRYTLRQVRNRLLAEESFRNIIDSRGELSKAPIRLIPTSSVGMGFAEQLPNGQMRKTGSQIRPFQVQLPIISVLPDFFAYARIELEGSELLKQAMRLERLARTEDHEQRRARWLNSARSLINLAAGPAARQALARRYPALGRLLPENSAELVDNLMLLAESAIRRHDMQAADQREQQLTRAAELKQTVNDDRSALHLVQAEFDEIVGAFDRTHPESLLSVDGKLVEEEPPPGPV